MPPQRRSHSEILFWGFLGFCIEFGPISWQAGASPPPEAMMHFPLPVSDFPLFSKNFQTMRKILKVLPFPKKFLDFHPPKFLMTFSFFSHRPQISISPLFSLF